MSLEEEKTMEENLKESTVQSNGEAEEHFKAVMELAELNKNEHVIKGIKHALIPLVSRYTDTQTTPELLTEGSQLITDYLANLNKIKAWLAKTTKPNS